MAVKHLTKHTKQRKKYMKYRYQIRLVLGFFGAIALICLNKGIISNISLVSYSIGIAQVELAIRIVTYLNKTEAP